MRVLGITELTKQGFSRTELMAIAHSKGGPAFKTAGGGKWLFDMNKFEKFLLERKASQ